jgi:chlorite dismutase
MTTSGYTKPSDDEIERINASVHYLAYSVFKVSAPLTAGPKKLAREVESALGGLAKDGLVVRGVYDVAGLRADADILVWWHAPQAETVQAAYHALLASGLGISLTPVWSAMGVHRPAEFNRSHVPAFLTDAEPGRYLCVYPFVRSYEWYLLPDDERRTLLRNHGQAAAGYEDVKANTVAAFALGDYEWLLAFEAEELHRIVDLMRDFRATDARRHVREEIPFYTGRRRGWAELLEAFPRA